MATDEYATLVTLHDLGKTIADTRDDIRGRKVADTDDHEIGKIDALLIDDKARKIRFLQVETGASWALAKRKHRSRSTRSRRSGKTKSASTLRKMT
jgi:sporulation protein YlmC with PRC-barrel domain